MQFPLSHTDALKLVLPQLGWSRADFESRGFFRIQLDWSQAANQKPRLRLGRNLESTWVDLSVFLILILFHTRTTWHRGPCM